MEARVKPEAEIDVDDFEDEYENHHGINKARRGKRHRTRHYHQRGDVAPTSAPTAGSRPPPSSEADSADGYQTDLDNVLRSIKPKKNPLLSSAAGSPPPRLELIRRFEKLEEMIRKEGEAREALEDMMMPLLIKAEQNQLITRAEVEQLIQREREARREEPPPVKGGMMVGVDPEQQFTLPKQPMDPEQFALPKEPQREEAPPPTSTQFPPPPPPPPPRLSALFNEEELNNLVDLRLTVKQAQDDDWHTPFGESVYTLLYMCPIQSQSFVYSIFVYAVQMMTIALTLFDILNDYIPAMVSPPVTMAQAFTILLLLATQSDLMEAVIKLQNGFYPEVLALNPGATYPTWLACCLLQLGTGILLLITSMILTLQSENVLDLMLNLTALQFMAEIDDMGFAMGKMGFITDTIQKDTESVADFRVPKRKRSNTNRRLLYILVLVFLYVNFTVFKREQIRGDNLPTYIYVQFGDAYNAKLPYYSGILASTDGPTLTHRTYRDIGTENILLGYCGKDKAWAFSEVDDPCDYFAKSLETETYDVSLIPDSDWLVVDAINRLQPFDSFSLVPRDCDSETCQGTCSSDGLCQCLPNSFGIDCEFSNVCGKLLVDERFTAFPPVRQSSFSDELTGAFAISNKFEVLQNPTTGEIVRVYNMPVYYSTETYPANVMFFGGRRWILTSEWDLFDMKKAKEEHPDLWFFPEKTVATLEDQFHGFHQANYTPFFISDPVDFETPNFQPTPIGLKWWIPKEDEEAPRHYVPDVALDTVIACDETLPESCVGKPDGFCGTGKCNARGFCQCKAELEYYGDRCDLLKPCYSQIMPCGGNGKCDVFSGKCDCNLPYFGDLCEEHFKCYEEGGYCKNGGVCDFESGRCDCPKDPAVFGLTCEKITDCLVVGCENGGVCGVNGACVCPKPFRGKHCHLVDTSKEKLLCSSDDDCMNGTCDLGKGICDCEDPANFGARCEYTYNCTTKATLSGPPCLNGGICKNSTGVCQCPEPFFGHDCSKVRPCSDDGECGFGKEETCDASTGECQCLIGPLQGKRCQKRYNCRGPDSDKCLHGGTCNQIGICLCVKGYSGPLCEQFVADMYDKRFDLFQGLITLNVTACGFDDPWCNIGNAFLVETVTSIFGAQLQKDEVNNNGKDDDESSNGPRQLRLLGIPPDDWDDGNDGT